MKTLKLFSMMIIALVISLGTYANTNVAPGTTKTEKIKVAGKCGMCKTRIEEAVKVNGVSKATWNEKTQYLTVTYAPDKITSLDIQKKIAAVGHDTEKVKATTKAYAGLPGCCKYARMK